MNLLNGLLNIRTGEFKEHSPKELSFIQLPVRYDPRAKPKLFGKFLNEVVYPEDVRTLVELIAYTLYRDNPFELITIVYGDGNKGKSVLFGILTALHGPQNVSNVSLKAIVERPFGLYDLYGKNCNLDAELSSGIIQDTAMLKKVTGRQRTRIEQKNKKAFDAVIYAKLWVSANKIPQTRDDSNAFYRRKIIIPFPNTFEDQEDLERGIRKLDPDLLSKLTSPEELSAILNVLLVTLRSILKDNRIFVRDKTIQQRREKYEKAVIL